jgi:serine-type D-Ala-D-Ala endopeptidase (penicillin-binding protein 7)
MARRNRVFCIALTLGIALFLEGAWVSGVDAQAPIAGTATTGGGPEAPGVTAPEQQPVGPKVAASTTAKRSSRSRSRRRYRSRVLRLPAVTPYGIPRLHVKAAYVIDANDRVLFQKNPERILPIASLTKLVTMMVFFQTAPEWDRVIEIVPEDVHNSSRTRIRPREEIAVRDLIHAALMSSDNCATKALVRTCGVPMDEFVRRMNLLVDSLGVPETRFVEPTGLSEQNVSTAQGMARILRAATENDVVSSITQKTDYSFTTNRRMHHLVNTNRLLRSQWNITGGKTGFIREAGYCLVTNVKGPTGVDITAVVLGAPSNALRFAEARRILDWTFRFGLNLPQTTPESD